MYTGKVHLFNFLNILRYKVASNAPSAAFGVQVDMKVGRVLLELI